MASPKAFVSPPRRNIQQPAILVQSSSPDLPPLQDILSQRSHHQSQQTIGNGPSRNTNLVPSCSRNAKKAQSSNTVASNSVAPIDLETPSPLRNSNLEQDEAQIGTFDKGTQSIRGSPSQDRAWRQFKSPPRLAVEGKDKKSSMQISSVPSSSLEDILSVDGPVETKQALTGVTDQASHQSPEVIKEDPSFPLNLERAPARRLDWTPPAKKTVSRVTLDSPGDDDVPPSTKGEEENQNLTTLLADFGYKDVNNVVASAPTDDASAFLKKRKLIELVSVPDSGTGDQQLPDPPAAKVKAVKKKARTITELATAAYQPRINVEPNTSTNTVTDTAAETPDETQTSTTKTGKGKGKAKPRKKTTKVKKKAEPKKRVLLSPSTALKQVEKQDFVFGTSSQLVREQSPTLLRDIQSAIKSSNQLDDPVFDTPINSDNVEPLESKPRLWEAGARDLEGELFNVEIVDLVDKSSEVSPTHGGRDPFGYFSADQEPTLPKLADIETSHEDHSFETLSDILPQPALKRVIKNNVYDASSGKQGSTMNKPQVAESVQETQVNAVSKATQPVKSHNGAAAPVAKQANRPSYELYTDAQLAKEFASYGFKPVKKRTAMITLLDKCWQSKSGLNTGAVRGISTSSSNSQPRASEEQATKVAASPKRPRGRPRKDSVVATEQEEPPPSAQPVESSPPRPRGRPRKVSNTSPPRTSKSPEAAAASQTTPSRGRGRPRKASAPSPAPARARGKESSTKASSSKTKKALPSKTKASITKNVIEIPDSASENDSDLSTPPHSSPEPMFSSPPAGDFSVSVGEDTELSLSLSPGEDEKTLFEHISKAVTTAPRSTDPMNPSWHEKILLYDPIVLEDLTAWLNSGQLTRVGHDSEVYPALVKKWCEAKSICCLWRVNLRGKERKRY